MTRVQVLSIGPVLLVAICYTIAAPARPMASLIPQPPEQTDNDPIQGQSISMMCQQSEVVLRSKLFDDWNLIVREPYVIAGDLPVEELVDCYVRTVVPTAQTLMSSYFAAPPNRPIEIILCSSNATFRDCNQRLDGSQRDQYSGIYLRKNRRMIVNVDSGEGTLAHELTHALAHADFPQMPEWFDEGLASLHEECEFSADGTRLIGNSNWRTEVALNALTGGELRLLEDITSNRFATRDRAHVDYAHVRTFCLYLQSRGELETFYRLTRQSIGGDPTGIRSLCHATNSGSPRDLDEQFRDWLLRQNTRATQ